VAAGTSGVDNAGASGRLLAGSVRIRRLLSPKENLSEGRGSNGRSPGSIRATGSAWLICNAWGEGRVCRGSAGLGSSLSIGPGSRVGTPLARPSSMGAMSVTGLPGGGA
jgi:hypothetical protein